MQKRYCNRYQGHKKQYKQLTILQKYMHIQREIRDSNFRNFQKHHEKSQNYKSLNSNPQACQEELQGLSDGHSKKGSSINHFSCDMTQRHVEQNPHISKLSRQLSTVQKANLKAPSYLQSINKMIAVQKQNQKQNQTFTYQLTQNLKTRLSQNIFSKQNSELNRRVRFSDCKDIAEVDISGMRERILRISISKIKSQKWKLFKKKPHMDSQILLVKQSHFNSNLNYIRQPIKLRRNYSNATQLFYLNEGRDKDQRAVVTIDEYDPLQMQKIQPWGDYNS